MNKEIKKSTEMFHSTYEMLAPKYGYETRGDTKQLDFDSPNGKLMYATIEKIVYPILEENQQLKEQYCERTDCSGRIGNSKKVEELEKENQKYKEVINKAIETMESWCFALDYAERDRLRIIIEILKEVE